MIRSMTGFGKARITREHFDINVEIKSVNNRYLDIAFKLPVGLNALELPLRDIIKEKVVRGKLNVFVDIRESTSSQNDVTIDETRLKHYFNILLAIRKTLGLHEDIRLEHLLNFTELFNTDFSNIEDEVLLEWIKPVFNQALDAMNQMCLQEGQNLKNDLTKRLALLTELATDVKENSKNSTREEFDKLYKRLEEMLDAGKIDRSRLEQEIALISDKVDISEECTRFESHLHQLGEAIKKGKELGKKLTFILQEMHREANTMNSKTNNIAIAHSVIRIKEEIEKMREQAQNLE